MVPVSLTQIADATNGTLRGQDEMISDISIDSRNVKKGSLYIAIKGEKFDGHSFIDEAFQNGAVAAVYSESAGTNYAGIMVEDTKIALGNISTYTRNSVSPTTIGITGSNGKTTVKEMIASILRKEASVVATKGNHNNEIGVPLTLLDITPGTDFAVIEMGARAPRDIAYLGLVANPDIGVITNAGHSHIEGFGDTRCVAKTKGELIGEVKGIGTIILNRDDQYYDYWCQQSENREIISFGFSKNADVHADVNSVYLSSESNKLTTKFTMNISGEQVDVTTRYTGVHNVSNSLAAAACAVACEIPTKTIVSGLADSEPVDGRLKLINGYAGSLILDDSYNANPESFRAAIDIVAQLPGKAWVVAGDMAELGASSSNEHISLGEYVQTKKVDRLLCIGENADLLKQGFQNAEIFDSIQDISKYIHENITDDVTLLIKGSRIMQLERLLPLIKMSQINRVGV